MILEKLEKLKKNESPGPDEIHPKLFYELRLYITKPLAKLFNLSLKYGIVPEDWRNAKVTPLFKKGSKSDVKNYRPVSLTSIPCKILETIIKENINIHLDKYNLISNSQHGFLSGKSCLSNLLEFYNVTLDWLDNKNSLDIIYLDFTKAFDKVPHLRLMSKLNSYGIGGEEHKWITQWLNKRKQRVVVNNCFSEWKLVCNGVPQGSVLWPQLFTVYIDDIDINIKSKLLKFANDTKLGKIVNNQIEADEFQADLNILNDWSKTWLMGFNLDKCVCMHVGTNNENFNYNIGGVKIKAVEKEKDLGVVIDKGFTFTEHSAAVVKKRTKC